MMCMLIQLSLSLSLSQLPSECGGAAAIFSEVRSVLWLVPGGEGISVSHGDERGLEPSLPEQAEEHG